MNQSAFTETFGNNNFNNNQHNNNTHNVFENSTYTLVNPLSLSSTQITQDNTPQTSAISNNFPTKKLPLLNLDIIEKADTCRIFTERVLSCYDSPNNAINYQNYFNYNNAHDVKKPQYVNVGVSLNNKMNEDLFHLTPKEPKDITYLQNISNYNNLNMIKSNTTTPKQGNFYVSPRTCFTKN